jgi:hypothetical protein
MRWIFVICGLAMYSGLARAEMVSSESIGNDPVKERLCATRAKGKAVPFEIDLKYVASARARHPDTTFVAIDGSSPQLVECYLREGTGKYEPASISPEQAFWRLPRPQQFEPGINTPKGISMAASVCLEAVPAKVTRPNFDHSVYSGVFEVGIQGPLYRAGASVAGTKAERYDIAVTGTAFFKSSGPDLQSTTFTCLLSPMLGVKAIQFK